MLMDRTGLFSDAQAVTTSVASTNIVDLDATGTPYGASAALRRDVGKGTDVPLTVNVIETFNNLTSLTIEVQTDDNPAFTSPTTVYRSPAYTLGQVAVGARYLLPDTIPVGTDERYMRLFYTVAGTAPSTGKITAGTTFARQSN